MTFCPISRIECIPFLVTNEQKKAFCRKILVLISVHVNNVFCLHLWPNDMFDIFVYYIYYIYIRKHFLSILTLVCFLVEFLSTNCWFLHFKATSLHFCHRRCTTVKIIVVAIIIMIVYDLVNLIVKFLRYEGLRAVSPIHVSNYLRTSSLWLKLISKS